MLVASVIMSVLACAAPEAEGPVSDTATDSSSDSGVDTAADSGAPPPADPSFRADVYPMYLSYCADCHAAWGGADSDAVYDWVMTETFRDVPLIVPGDHTQSLLWSKLAQDPPLAGAVMPLQLPAYSESDLAAVRAWIEGGAANDDTFRPVAQQYLRYGCEDCHSEWREDLYGVLTTSSAGGGAYPFVVPGAPDESLYYQKIASENPPVGARMPIVYPLLPAETTDRIAAWIDAGARND